MGQPRSLFMQRGSGSSPTQSPSKKTVSDGSSICSKNDQAANAKTANVPSDGEEEKETLLLQTRTSNNPLMNHGLKQNVARSIGVLGVCWLFLFLSGMVAAKRDGTGKRNGFEIVSSSEAP